LFQDTVILLQSMCMSRQSTQPFVTCHFCALLSLWAQNSTVWRK